MNSLEVLIITSFAFLAIFAVMPVVFQQIYYYQALVESRAVLAFFNSIADALESDLGAGYAQRVLYIPGTKFGSISYSVNAVMYCNGNPVYNTTFVYKSQYLSLFGMYRGTTWGALVNAPEPVMAIHGWGTSVSLTPRMVKYGSIIVVFNVTYSVLSGATGSAFFYNVSSPSVYPVEECSVVGITLPQDVDTVVVVPVRLQLR